MATRHVSVLLKETLQALAIRPGGLYVDGTCGGGGHAAGILDGSSPDGRLLALDADPAALALARERLEPFGARVTLTHSSFAGLGRVARENGFEAVDGILLDLGLSSDQLADLARGFSFSSLRPTMRSERSL